MAEWLVEQGIGEERALLVEQGEVLAARLRWPGKLASGLVEDMVLVSRAKGAKRGTARSSSGEQVLVDGLPAKASEGAPIRLKITRPSLAESGRLKLAQARPTDEAPRAAPSLQELTGGRVVHAFAPGLWEQTIHTVWHGALDFPGGTLSVNPTPAMTLIDIDGTLPPRELALAAVPAIAHAIALFDLAGSIGIDFPTLQDKADRRAVDAALGAALDHWPHERTAMNGFGFVQIVARLERRSLLNYVTQYPQRAGARMLLRAAERINDPGVLLLTCSADLRCAVTPEMEAELIRRTGRTIRWAEQTGLAPVAAYAQAVES